MAIETFERGLPDSGSPEERLVAAIRDANQRIHEISATEHERAGMGTTLTAAYLDDAQLAIAHVGDSRAYLLRDGTLQRLTQDHSLVEELVRRGKLTEEQAAEHPQRSIITRALGPEPDVEVDTWSYPVRAGDVLLLCSDGLTSMISEEQIAKILSDADGLDRAAQRLIDEANQAGGRDNITVVLVRLEEVDGNRPLTTEAPTMMTIKAPREPSDPSKVGAAVAARPEQTEGARVAPQRVDADRPPAAPITPRRYRRPLAVLLATLVVLFLIGGGGWLATRQLFFIGTNAQGIVTIYRGLPYDLPAGIHLYETFYVSGVPAALVPADRRSALFNHQLRSQSDAQTLVRDLELGQLSK
jgi:protein phosphatase